MTGKLSPRKAEPVGPVAQRNELLRKRDEAYRRYAEQTQERQRAERATGSLAKRIATMDFGSEADGEGELDLEVAHATAEADYRRHLEHANAALDRVKVLEAEVESLHERSFATFAEEASLVTERADVALQDFATAYRRAVQAWTEAVEAWAPLSHAVRVSGVPSFPVGEHLVAELLRGEIRAQPPHIEVMEPLPGDGDELTG